MTTKDTSLVDGMIAHVVSELNAIDVEQRFRDMLDEIYDFDNVGGPFSHMLPSEVLEEMDPIAFRCGCADHSSSEDWYEINGDQYEIREVDEAADEYIADLESQLTDLESDLAELEANEEEDGASETKQQIANLQAEIDACQKYKW